jgi:hypothetical protein
MPTLDPDDRDEDVLDQPGALERAAAILGLPAELLAAQVDADRQWSAELAAMPDPMAELLAGLGPDPLLAELPELPELPTAPSREELAAWEAADAELVWALSGVLDPPELAEVLGLNPPDDDDRSSPGRPRRPAPPASWGP